MRSEKEMREKLNNLRWFKRDPSLVFNWEHHIMVEARIKILKWVLEED